MTTLVADNTYRGIGQWAMTTFGPGKPLACYAKLGEEFGELARPLQKQDNAQAALEMADVIVVLCHMAVSLGVDLDRAVADKMLINRARTWSFTPVGTAMHNPCETIQPALEQQVLSLQEGQPLDGKTEVQSRPADDQLVHHDGARDTGSREDVPHR